MERPDDYDESKAQWVWSERAARSRVAELEEALRPFAEAADRFGIDDKDLAVAREVLRKSSRDNLDSPRTA